MLWLTLSFILQNLHDPGSRFHSCHFTDEKTEVQTDERMNEFCCEILILVNWMNCGVKGIRKSGSARLGFLFIFLNGRNKEDKFGFTLVEFKVKLVK